MKKFILVFFVGSMLFFTSCMDDDGYSLNNQWIGFGVLQDTDHNWIVLDNGDLLKPVSYGNSGYWYVNSRDGLKAGDRLLVNYTILSEDLIEDGKVVAYLVRINSVKEILLKQIIDLTTENKDSIGDDPIDVKEVWVANDMLNFKIKYWGENKTHFINLVKHRNMLMTVRNQPVELELKHNANNDSERIYYSAYVSFHLDSIRTPGLDSVKFKVTCNDYDGETFEYEGIIAGHENKE